MRIEIAKPPSLAVTAAQKGLERVMSRAGGTAARILAQKAGALELASPHEIYTVDLLSLAQSRLLAGARSVGWRFLVVGREQVLAAVEVQHGESPKSGDTYGSSRADAFEFALLNDGPYVAATRDAVERFEKLLPDRTKAGVREVDPAVPRLLRIPALYVVAVWFHGTEDSLLPLAPAPTTLEPLRPYNEQQLLEILRPLAITRLESDEYLHEQQVLDDKAPPRDRPAPYKSR